MATRSSSAASPARKIWSKPSRSVWLRRLRVCRTQQAPGHAGSGARLRAAVPAGIGVVALVMDNPADEVRAIVETLHPDVLQCHGGESEGFAAQFGLPYWKVVAMGGDPCAALAHLADYPQAQAFLFDGHAAGEPGGSGRRFDWAALPAGWVARSCWPAGWRPATWPLRSRKRGRGGGRVQRHRGCPGIKSAEKMRAFVAALRGTSG
jgi:phosphoribosylanthranilate isomerase